MSNVYRVGLLLGVIGSLVVYGLGRMAGLTAAVGVITIGLLAGLAMAKWLEWGWFGRQIAAGLRAGLLACGLVTVAGLAALITQGPHDISALAAQSHLGGLSLAPLARSLGALGWLGVDIVVLVMAYLAGTVLAVGVTEVFAYGKSGEAVRTVSQARLAAEALRGGRAWSGVASRPIAQKPGSLTGGPQWQSSPTPSAAPRATKAPAPQSAAQSYGDSEELANFYTPAAPPSGQRKTSEPQPVGDAAMNYLDDETRLREAMREALSMWADESEEGAEEQPTQRRKREPKREANPSAFLNAEQRPKSRRKKTNTRDWLC
jgi:hypothetical protein